MPDREKPRRQVDMKQVAALAGVSTATVSRVLSRSGYASAHTRARVREAAERLGYRPDAMARGLRKMQGTTLGILVPDLTNPVTLSFIRGVQHVAQPCGFAVTIGDAQRDAEIERRQLELFQDQRVAAVIVADMMREPDSLSILGGGVAVVHSPGDLEDEDMNEGAAIGRAMDDLARQGHRRVLFASRAPLSHGRGGRLGRVDRRRQAVVTAAARRKMTVDQCSTPAQLSTTATAGRLGEWLGEQGPDHAVLCASHRMAPQLLGTLSEMRLGLPREVSFITFGDSDWARAYRPAVSVIRFDRYREARSVTHDLLLRLGASPVDEEPPSPPEYVARGSVGPCPGSGPRPGT